METQAFRGSPGAAGGGLRTSCSTQAGCDQVLGADTLLFTAQPCAQVKPVGLTRAGEANEAQSCCPGPRLPRGVRQGVALRDGSFWSQVGHCRTRLTTRLPVCLSCWEPGSSSRAVWEGVILPFKIEVKFTSRNMNHFKVNPVQPSPQSSSNPATTPRTYAPGERGGCLCVCRAVGV